MGRYMDVVVNVEVNGIRHEVDGMRRGRRLK